jgi:uncharacterized protein YqeY
MDLRDRVNHALKQAMKDKDQSRLATPLGDPDILAILAKMTKQRNESVRAYEEGGRLDLAERERAEIAVIEDFLPRQLDDAEVAAAIDRAIADVGASSIRDMGKIMARLRDRHAGQMDFGAVGGQVKARLG